MALGGVAIGNINPMLAAMVYHAYPSTGERRAMTCSCVHGLAR